MSEIDLKQRYISDQLYLSQVKLPNTLTAMLDYCQYSIGVDFCAADKTKLKIKNRKRQLNKQFVEAFNTLTREQKVEYYCKNVKYLRNFFNSNFETPKCNYSGMINEIGFCRSYSLKMWKQKKLRFDLETLLMYAERQTKIKTYDMRDYLVRRSKNKDYYCLVLQAINSNPHEKSRTVHIGFPQTTKFNAWWEIISFAINYRAFQFLLNTFKNTLNNRPINGKAFTTDDIKIKNNNGSFYQSNTQYNQSIGENMMAQSMLVEAKFQNFSPSFQKKISIKKNKKQQSSILPVTNKISIEDEIIKQKIRQKQLLQQQIRKYQQQKHSKTNKLLVDQLIQGQIFEEPDVFQDKIQEQKQQSKQTKLHLDLFHRLQPDYDLQDLKSLDNFKLLSDQNQIQIYQHEALQKKLKLKMTFDKSYNKQKILNFLCKIGKTDLLNQNIQQIQMKTLIASQNSAIMYQINKQYNKLYRSRDFVFIRHVFCKANELYMIDKSIQNTNYPPFMTIVRGSCCIIYGIFQYETNNELLIQFQINQQGLLNPPQQKNLNLKYIKGYIKLLNKQIDVINYDFFDLDWDITKNKDNEIDQQIRSRKKTINQIKKKISENQEETKEAPNFKKKQSPQKQTNIQKQRTISISSENQNRKKSLIQDSEFSHDQKPSNSKTYITDSQIIRQLNQEGMVIINQQYRHHKYQLAPLNNHPQIFMEAKGTHPIWKGEWIHDDKQGGLIFINKKKIDDQKGVLKFILSKIAKNLLSGQSITTISLPVDIFGAESNLQRFLFSMTYGPVLFQNLQQANLLTRLLRSIIFGISNSILYLSMEKPFNPILGQTFQCWINGCPAYAQQISHHPPVGALMFKGRGYDISAQIESKVSLGVNSGTGTNDGIYRIKFTDGIQICFVCPGGQVSGLTAGDRKFNLVGKSYYWITGTNIMLELVFDPFKKGFFSVGKQQKPSDYFEGVIYEVKPEFMVKFINGKRKQPDQKQRIKQYGKVSGIWNKYICYNNEQIFNFDQSFPIMLEYQPYPLPSDANWREDIEYRRRNEVTRAQTQKQRLQVLQRKDRKNRQKFNKKK